MSEHHAEHSAAAAPAAHAEGHPETYQMPTEFPDIYSLATSLKFPEHEGGETESPFKGPFAIHGAFWVNPLFSFSYAAVVLVIIARIMRKRSLRNPSKPQVALEMIFGGLYNFFRDVLGSEDNARKYGPFVGTLFVFIFINNFFGIIPLLKSPTAHFWTTIGLGLCTFMYVNYHGLKAGGLWHYFHHLCGAPQDTLGWWFAILILPLEIMGTLVKPISLALRLSGNIFGEDKLLAAFMGIGVAIAAFLSKNSAPGWGLPLHFPFLFLGMLTSLIQALVFSLLSAVYISLLLPHGDHHGEEGDHGHGEGHGHGEEGKGHHAPAAAGR